MQTGRQTPRSKYQATDMGYGGPYTARAAQANGGKINLSVLPVRSQQNLMKFIPCVT